MSRAAEDNALSAYAFYLRRSDEAKHTICGIGAWRCRIQVHLKDTVPHFNGYRIHAVSADVLCGKNSSGVALCHSSTQLVIGSPSAADDILFVGDRAKGPLACSSKSKVLLHVVRPPIYHAMELSSQSESWQGRQ
jgi:hypothetical protein